MVDTSALRLILVGFGNVGKTLAGILAVEKSRFSGLEDLDVSVVSVLTRSRGTLLNPKGVDLVRALEEVARQGCFDPENPDFSSLNSDQVLSKVDFDVLVELSTLQIENRGEPAASFMRNALKRGAHVVSANKGPLAFHFRELHELAARSRRLLLFESTVMDGTPVFNLYRTGLQGCRVLRVEGNLNSTTNLVLQLMEQGYSLDEGVAVARARGISEENPSYDLDGWDAAAKICVLANVMLGSNLVPTEVPRCSILSLDRRTLDGKKAAGRRPKVIARAWHEKSGVKAAVELCWISNDHPFWGVGGPGAALAIHTDLLAPLLVIQTEPDLYDTAYGVLNDLLTILRSRGPFFPPV